MLNTKLHPIDFDKRELGEVRNLFPENVPLPDGSLPQEMSLKKMGITFETLSNEIKQRLNIDEEALWRLLSSMNSKNPDKITWNELLTNLIAEGARREQVNDAMLYGYGVKRLNKIDSQSLKSDTAKGDKAVEHYVDNMLLIKHKNTKMLLTLFANKQAKLLDLKSLQQVQEIKFKSDYGKPKPEKLN